MNRRPSTQDITWLLDLQSNKQLDLNPSYQRRSVWTLKDRQFFLDTLFRNFPSPAIFLHKDVNDSGKSTYHVVDGKQRIETILLFVEDKISLSREYGDNRLDGKKWSDLAGENELKQQFWNYQITVEQIDIADGSVVNTVFERLNRNARRLTSQELRHAKFEGWLVSKVETEISLDEWSTLGVASKARAKRMMDCQFISELLLVLLEQKVLGFDQNGLDEFYAKYEDISETAAELDEDLFQQKLEHIKHMLICMEKNNSSVTTYAKGFGHFYSLWALLALTEVLPEIDTLSQKYASFMSKVFELGRQDDIPAFLENHSDDEYSRALRYLTNFRGASTDLAPRLARLEVLCEAIKA